MCSQTPAPLPHPSSLANVQGQMRELHKRTIRKCDPLCRSKIPPQCDETQKYPRLTAAAAAGVAAVMFALFSVATKQLRLGGQFAAGVEVPKEGYGKTVVGLR